MASELRRRKGRTVLTALGLGVGVALVVTVAAMSDGLNTAQDKVLQPLTGVGTDMSVQRPLSVSEKGAGEKSGQGEGGSVGFGGLSEAEQQRLTEENKTANFSLQHLGEPGERFETTQFLATTQLSFPSSEARKIASLPGVEDVSEGLTLTAANISGKVPEDGGQPSGGGPFGGGAGPGAQGAGGAPSEIDFDSSSVTGVAEDHRSLGALTSAQVADGRYFSSGRAREAVLNLSYARRKGLDVGDRIELKGRGFEVIGLASPPLGGQASDVYVKLAQLQRLSKRGGRSNTIYVRAASAGQVDSLSEDIQRTFEGSQVTTSQELADRVGGSLVDAKNLSEQLGAALTIVGLVAAFLIASLLTLASVAKRVRELGTLKAIGWPQRLVVRQVTGEALAQGALGGIVGAALGVGGAAILTAIGPELEATVAQPAQQAPPGLAQGTVNAGTKLIELDAPVDAGLIVLAVALALVGGLLAGVVGGVRAARLTPADALRHIG
jgi:ABC-type antimicrobial peptide transport system permease subunit